MKKQKTIRLAYIITTYNRISEARGQMDIIRSLWEPNVRTIDIYHEFGGKSAWYKEKYKEDYLFKHRPRQHFAGAIHLIEQGLKHVLENGNKYDLIVVASADAWIYDQNKIDKILKKCIEKKYQIISSLWYISGLATEFFIITPSLAKKILPLRFDDFLKDHKYVKLLNDYINSPFMNTYMPWAKPGVIEAFFTWKVLKKLGNLRKVFLIPGRRFIFFHNRFYSPEFYLSHHSTHKRRKITRKFKSSQNLQDHNNTQINQLLS